MGVAKSTLTRPWRRTSQRVRPVNTCAAAVKWTSGALYSAKEAAEFKAKVAAAAMTEEQRLAALRADERLPLVFLDVTIKVRLSSNKFDQAAPDLRVCSVCICACLLGQNVAISYVTHLNADFCQKGELRGSIVLCVSSTAMLLPFR